MSPGRSVLFVLAGPGRASAHAEQAHAHGLSAGAADSGMHALTQLERQPPDLIVCDEALPDMRGTDLVQILREDPATAHLPAVLLTAGPPAPWAGPHDHFCPPTPDSRPLFAFLLGLLAPGKEAPGADVPGADGLLLDDGLPGTEEAPAVDSPAAGAGLRGTLDLIELPDLLMFLSQMRKTGQLQLRLGEQQAQLVLLHGEVLAASWAGLRGKAAFLHTLLASETAPSAAFSFQPLDEATLAGVTRDVTTPTRYLLLDAAVWLDHARAALNPPPFKESHA